MVDNNVATTMVRTYANIRNADRFNANMGVMSNRQADKIATLKVSK